GAGAARGPGRRPPRRPGHLRRHRLRLRARAARRPLRVSAWLLLRKDLRVLRRPPLLLVVLLAYPLLVAGLVGLVAGYASSKPRVAFVDEDNLPRILALGGHRFHV